MVPETGEMVPETTLGTTGTRESLVSQFEKSFITSFNRSFIITSSFSTAGLLEMVPETGEIVPKTNYCSQQMTEYTSPVRAFQSLEYTIYWSGPVKFANHCQLLDLVKRCRFCAKSDLLTCSNVSCSIMHARQDAFNVAEK